MDHQELIASLSYDQIRDIGYWACEACKGKFWMYDSECYKDCKDFLVAAREYEEQSE